jgi:hypothetical protein
MNRVPPRKRKSRKELDNPKKKQKNRSNREVMKKQEKNQKKIKSCLLKN